MTIELSNQQYEDLVKLVYMGNWVVNAIRIPGEEVMQYEEIAQYIYSFAKQAGLEHYIEYDPKFEEYFPSAEFEDDADIQQYIDEYNDEQFWDELLHRLAERDFERDYGAKARAIMDWKERIEKEQPYRDRYGTEFEKNGIDNLSLPA